ADAPPRHPLERQARRRPHAQPRAGARISEHPTPGVEVRVEDWRDHKTERPYDSVISVAAFEAFVHHGMEPAARMAAKREHDELRVPRTLLKRNESPLTPTAPPRMSSPPPPRACRDPRGRRRECVGSV